jgi:hypothetical protein
MIKVQPVHYRIGTQYYTNFNRPIRHAKQRMIRAQGFAARNPGAANGFLACADDIRIPRAPTVMLNVHRRC